ncbi:hypothetical protein ACP70R_046210 [Stipagrostis hirtigluma subsp. patula]
MPGEGGVKRAWTQRADLRGLVPRPPRPHAAGGRGEGASAARGRKEPEEEEAGRHRARAAVPRREVAGANAAAVESGLVGDGALEAAGSTAARKEWGAAEMGRKRASPAPPTHPQPKRRAVSAIRRFPPGCGRDAAAPLAGADDGEQRNELVPAAPSPPKPRVVSAERRLSPGCGRRLTLEADEPPADAALVVSKKMVPKSRASQVSAHVTLHGSADGRLGPSALPIDAVEASVKHPSNQKIIRSKLQCGEKKKGPSWVDVEVMNKSGAISSNVVAQSLAAEGPSKERLRGKSVPQIAQMNKASAGIAAGVSARGKMVPMSARDTQREPFSKDKEKATASHLSADEIENTDELSTYLAMQAHTPSEKRPMTLGKEDASAFRSKEKFDDKMASSLECDKIVKEVVVHDGRLELHLNGSSVLSMRCQRKHGFQNDDARTKVKMLCRMFEFICRALMQAVEQRSLRNKRIDFEAAEAISTLPGFIKHGPIVGQVPGVEIGDVFLYRVQLAIVGLHRGYQGGIDITKDGSGLLIAISIVASGGYPDEFSSSGELIYTGSGGKLAGKKHDEDQKLERGNLALKNCIETRSPVRVIHGFKGQNRKGGSHSRGKEIPTFTYDGLYHVVDCWREGQPGSRMFKYRLLRISGQPELPLHIAKRLMKSKVRQGLCIADISQGKEGTPICVINTVDDVLPAQFRYVTRVKKPLCLTQRRPQGCGCTSGCSDSASCACAVKNGGAIPFNRNGAIVNDKPLIFECGPSCKCPPSCHNRVSQHGMKIPLEVFRTSQTGWGVRSLLSISSGSFICEYVGELLHGKDADARRNSSYLFDIGHYYDDENLSKGLVPTLSGVKSSGSCSQTMEDVGFKIDATEYGNIGRFINHSCSPNLFVQKVLWDHDDKRKPHIMFFAAETIPPLQELTYDYNNYRIDHVPSANGRTNFISCHCGSPQCCGRLY